MGWATGSCIMSDIIRHDLTQTLDDCDRRDIYIVLIDSFQKEDADTLDDCLGKDPMYDEAYYYVNSPSDLDYNPEDDYDPDDPYWKDGGVF